MSDVEEVLMYHLGGCQVSSVQFKGLSITIIFDDGTDLTVMGNIDNEVDVTVNGVDALFLKKP